MALLELDPEVCYRVLQTRDERFDGRIFVGVTSTGIYCRPVCPARTAKLANCRFYPSAAAAQEAGFRPCLRCRPETAPEMASWRGTSNTVSRGLALIAEGELDGESASVERLAERLGVGGRQLRRLFQQHLGASPIAVAQTRRVLFAKQLIHDTRLSMGDIALAAGFGSVRRFNETFHQLYRRPPATLRRKAVGAAPRASSAVSGVTVRLRYRPPYDWSAMLSHLRSRAIEGIEQVEGETYRRTLGWDGETGTVEIAHAPTATSLVATIRISNVRALAGIVARIRRAFDLGADVAAIGSHLSRDRLLAALIAERPGLRTPGGWDGFELAVRAVLGQQVSVEAGRQLAGKLVRICGTELAAPLREGALVRAFPSAAQVVEANLGELGMPDARRRALRAVARASLDDPRVFEPLGTIEQTVERLCTIEGVGTWTAHYIALRAGREPDAFPASDRGLLRGASLRAGTTIDSTNLLARAERWRPFRAYAAQHLWAADAAEKHHA